MAKIIVLSAMKDGVGKSVSTYNRAYSLKKLGKNVLVVDFDSSANITRCVVEDIKTVTVSIGDLMMNQMDEEEQPNPAEYIINRNGVDFIPSSQMLSAVDAKLRLEMGAEKILASDSYHSHSKCRTLKKAIRDIRGHDQLALYALLISSRPRLGLSLISLWNQCPHK